MISISRQQSGPLIPVYAALDDLGNLPTALGDTQLLFDGMPAPLAIVDRLGISAQVPYELAGKDSTVMQITYLGIPYAKVTLPVVPASPALLQRDFTITVAAQNQDGTPNSASSPAAVGSTISLPATGVGPLDLARPTGGSARAPFSSPLWPLSLLVGAVAADVLNVTELPGTVGLVQLTVKLPANLSLRGGAAQAFSLLISAGEYRSAQSNVVLWIR